MDPLKVFISYRRADTQHVAGRLGDRVDSRFTLFMDIDDIPLGVDFSKALDHAVDSSDVVLVLIGPRFLAADANGRRRIDLPGDWVVTEVSAALKRDLVVIPVLVDDAEMPEQEQLPQALWPLRRRQALRLSHATFNSDVEKLVDALTGIERTKYAEGASGPPAVAHSRDELFRDPQYSQALAAGFRRQWAEAVALYTAVLQRFPTDERVKAPLAEARQGMELQRLAASARDAEARGAWWEAVVALEKLTAARPNDQSASARLATARREVQVADLIGQLRALTSAQEWAGALEVSRRIATIDPSRADPDGLAGIARTRLTETELQSRYALGLAELNRGNIRQAAEMLEAIRQEQPGYREVDDLLGMIRERLAPTRGEQPASRPPPRAVTSTQMMARPVAQASVLASVQPTRATRPLADTGWIWLVVGAMALLVGIAQAAAGGLFVFFLTVFMTVLLAVLMGRDLRNLDRRVTGRLRIWSAVAALSGLLLVIPLGAIMVELVAHAYLDAYRYWWNRLGFLLAQVAISVVWFPLLRGKLGRAAAWPTLICLAGALLMSMIMVTNFEAPT